MKMQNLKDRTKNTEHRQKTKDKRQKSKEVKTKSKDKRLTDKAVLVLCSVFLALFLFTAASAAKWQGVDESVVEKYAEEHGRKARDPLINTDQGDLLLFLFLLAGAVGGFTAGYYWRVITEHRTQNTDNRRKYRTTETQRHREKRLKIRQDLQDEQDIQKNNKKFC